MTIGRLLWSMVWCPFTATGALGQTMNACPVDGCIVTIESAALVGDELELQFSANFLPDMAKNHIHVWWGEKYSIEQVSNNAETVYGVVQGDWHPTASFPGYVTTGAASVANRDGATTLCVTASDRKHDIIDATLLMCLSVEDLLPS